MSHVPTDDKKRKSIPICTGVLDYFPDALLAVAEVSREGNEQHNPGEPLHWAKEKSTDEADSLVRHLIDRGKFDKDGQRHSAKIAWRALALLQREIEEERNWLTRKADAEAQACPIGGVTAGTMDPPKVTAEEAMEGLPEEAKDALRDLKRDHDRRIYEAKPVWPGIVQCNSDKERIDRNVGNPCFAGPGCACGGKKDGGKTAW